MTPRRVRFYYRHIESIAHKEKQLIDVHAGRKLRERIPGARKPSLNYCFNHVVGEHTSEYFLTLYFDTMLKI